MKLTPTQKAAFKSLKEHNSSGVITKTGSVLAGGEVLGRYEGEYLIEVYSSKTWLALMTLGAIEPDGPQRIRINPEFEMLK